MDRLKKKPKKALLPYRNSTASGMLKSILSNLLAK